MDTKTYAELHGSNNWVNLLDPLDLGLRTLLLGYGDLSSSAERSFNNDAGSKYCGYSRYGKSLFFKGAILPWADSKYDVVSFIYATARIDPNLALLFPGMSREGSEFESNWMGFLAVSNDTYSKFIGRREICVVWRGTVRNYEWIDDIMGAMPVPAEPLFPGSSSDGTTDTPQVMGGWLTIYSTGDPNSPFVKSSAQAQLSAQIKELLIKYTKEKVSITCTGHSLGACLAVLSAFDLARNVVTPDINVSSFIFACPQVGNQSFKKKIEEQPNLKILRVKENSDIIPFWPSRILKWIDEQHWKSVPSALLEGLGWVNMSTDLLKEDNQIPPNWWAEKNKGMVFIDNGLTSDWVLAPVDPNDHDLPSNLL
nr:phospholipase A1-IIdelta-like [Tanacetum cinerariifolium]